MAAIPKKTKKLQKYKDNIIGENGLTSKAGNKLNQIKALPKSTKNFLKQSYNKFENNPENSKNSNLARTTLISGPTSNPTLSRIRNPVNNSIRSSQIFQTQSGSTTSIKSFAAKQNLNRHTFFPNQVQVDTELFFKEDFDPQNYLEEAFNISTKSGLQLDLKAHCEALKETAAKANLDLQSHVYNNYTEFVNISQEISQLEKDMFELKDLLKELQRVGQSFNECEGVSNNFSKDTKSKNSDNNANSDNAASNQDLEENDNLEETNRKELEKIYKLVHGSQEYLPYLKGRRPILDSEDWKELDSNSYRPKRDAHFFLLTDSILIATKSKRQTMMADKHGSKSGLVARGCLKFTELALADIKDNSEVKEAIKVIYRNEVYVFSAKSKDMKKKFVNALTRAITDYVRSLHQKALAKTTKKVGETLMTTPTNKLEGNEGTTIVLTSEFWDRLDIYLSHHQYQSCVNLILQFKALDQLTDIRISNRVEKLAGLIEQRIKTSDDPQQLSLHVRQLQALKLDNKAIRAALDSRKRLLRYRLSQLEPDGDVVGYVDALSQVTFGTLAVTCRWYTQLFPNPNDSSALVAEVRGELATFGQTYLRQVEGQKPKVVESSKRTVLKHTNLLHGVGLDFSFLLEDILT